MTAGHCSVHHILGTPGVDTTNYWQSVRNVAGDSLGRESLEPGWFTGAPCETGNKCRFTDVNLTFLHTTAAAKPGLIARTANPSSNPTLPGWLQLNRLSPGLFVTAVDTFAPPSNTTVCKTGRSTGTTCGPSRSTSEYQKEATVGGVEYWVWYQTDFHAWSKPGDSGSPVYRWNGSDSTVMFEGIFVGSPEWCDCDSLSFFSTWDWITDEVFNYTNIMSIVADTPYSVGPVGVYLIGDTGIGVPATYTWYAGSFGGTGSYTYQWKSQDSGSSTWDSHGTSSYQALPIYSYTPKFTLRLIASSGGTSDTADVFVNVYHPR